jgi:hypothetical protein
VFVPINALVIWALTRVLGSATMAGVVGAIVFTELAVIKKFLWPQPLSQKE